MEHTLRDFTFTLIDQPLSRHCIAWEMAVRSLKSADAKPLLNKVVADLKRVRVTDTNVGAMLALFGTIAESLDAAIEVLEDNESLTASADYAVMVKAAVRTGWILSPSMTEAEIDDKPQWLVNWMAQRINDLYLEAVIIPKN